MTTIATIFVSHATKFQHLNVNFVAIFMRKLIEKKYMVNQIYKIKKVEE
jgi:hypothetical protein